MKFSGTLALWCSLAFFSASLAQSEHLITDVEIPLDDFPVSRSGYRVQVAALSSQDSAFVLREQLVKRTHGRVYLRWEDGLFKIRMGDCLDSTSAVNELSAMISLGLSDAFIVPDRILIPESQVPTPDRLDGWRLQLEALSDCTRALDKARSLVCRFDQVQMHLVRAENLYKIQLGDFRSPAAAESLKVKMADMEDLKPVVVEAKIFDLPTEEPVVNSPSDIFEFNDDP